MNELVGRLIPGAIRGVPDPWSVAFGSLRDHRWARCRTCDCANRFYGAKNDFAVGRHFGVTRGFKAVPKWFTVIDVYILKITPAV